MVMTDSRNIYEQNCRSRRHSSANQESYSFSPLANSLLDNRSFDVDQRFVELIKTIFFELISKRRSKVISFLCSESGISKEFLNFRIDDGENNAREMVDSQHQISIDLLLILEGINIAFSKDLNECCYENNFKSDPFRKNIFYNYFYRDGNYLEKKEMALRLLALLDDQIGRVLMPTSQEKEVPAPQKESEKTIAESNSFEPIFRSVDPKITKELNQFAKIRNECDSELSKQLQQLQKTIQSELQQILSIREGIEYVYLQEPISQFINLYSQINETLKYHPDEKNKAGYANLVENCLSFLGQIEQSLVMLNVTIINNTGELYNPEKNKAISGIQPSRSSIVSKVFKVGFAYNDKVLEKAEVELA